MEVIAECCAGLDVHQASVVACLNVGSVGMRSRKEVRRFGTTRAELTEMRGWLAAAGCTLVAMESTGVYWKPVYAVLEGHFDLVVGNAQHIKNVPGRKTDVKDCEWISDLARHGLIAKSFVPPRPIRDLRDLTRYRRKLAQAQAAECNRLIKLLETANIKLAGVISDVLGVSGRAMLQALIEGERSPAEMAGLARGRMRDKKPQLERALDGGLDAHHRDLLGLQLQRIKAGEADLARLDERIDKHRRLRARRGALRAAVAIGHKILVCAYRMLATGANYRDLGAAYLDGLDRRRSASHLLRRLRDMGYDVQATPKAA